MKFKTNFKSTIILSCFYFLNAFCMQTLLKTKQFELNSKNYFSSVIPATVIQKLISEYADEFDIYLKLQNPKFAISDKFNISALTYAPNGNFFAFAINNFIYIVNMNLKIYDSIINNTGLVATKISSLAISPCNKYLASNSDNVIKIYQLDNQSLFSYITWQIKDAELLLFSPDSKYLICKRRSKRLRIYDLNNKSAYIFNSNRSICTIDFTSCNKYLIYGNEIGEFGIWEFNKFMSEKFDLLESDFNIDAKYDEANIKDRIFDELDVCSDVDDNSITHLRCSPCGNYLAINIYDCIEIWDMKKFISNLQNNSKFNKEHNFKISLVNYDPNTDLEKSKYLIHKLSEHTQNLKKIIFLPNSNFLLLNYLDGSIKIWDISTKMFIDNFFTDNDKKISIADLACSSDGQYLVYNFNSGVNVYRKRYFEILGENEFKANSDLVLELPTKEKSKKCIIS